MVYTLLYQNAGMRLYGGAQYHRAMAEFRFIVGNTKCPEVSREEIVNACGVEDIHDGTNYFRSCLPLYMFCCIYICLISVPQGLNCCILFGYFE